MENKVTTETVKVFKCLHTNCEFNTTSSANFLHHFSSHIDRKIEFKYYDSEEIKKCHIIENKFMCTICYEIFTNSRSALKAHYIKVHGFKEKVEVNTLDESSSHNESDMKTTPIHIPDSDNCCSINSEDTEKCKKSKKSKLKKTSSLDLILYQILLILATKGGDVIQRWYTVKTCEICKQTFKNSKTLSKHIKVVHHKIKSFICKLNFFL